MNPLLSHIQDASRRLGQTRRLQDRIVECLRKGGARFAHLHGSQAEGTAGAASDVDVAAFFGRDVDSWGITLPDGVDLLVLDTAPLELAG